MAHSREEIVNELSEDEILACSQCNLLFSRDNFKLVITDPLVITFREDSFKTLDREFRDKHKGLLLCRKCYNLFRHTNKLVKGYCTDDIKTC